MPPQLILALLLILAVPGEGLAETMRQEGVSNLGRSLSPDLLAQSTLPLPDGVPWGTTIRLDGDPSNAPTNRILQQGFKQRFPGATIQLASRGSDIAVQSLLEGDLDIAALGRRLTSQERAKGLVAIPMARHKIAIIISPDNPFSGSLTDAQFAQIFRGEITDWEELGGEPGPIRLIDRPETSDTRRAFSNYPVFQSAPFQAGETSIQVNDRTDDVIKALGSDGIGYAIVDQVSDRNDLTIVPLHNVMPDDARYAFSQPLAYVYKGPVPNPAAQAFLGYANATSQAGDLVASKTAAAALGSASASPRTLNGVGDTELNATESDGANALNAIRSGTADELGLDAPVAQVGQSVATPNGRTPWWWLLLPLAVIPLLFHWMKRGSGPLAWGETSAGVGAASPVPGGGGASEAGAVGPAVGSGNALTSSASVRGGAGLAGAGLAGAGLAGAGMANRHRTAPQLVLAARDCHHAYAYWELSEEQRASFQAKGGQALKLRLFDVTKPIQGDRPFRQYHCELQDNDLEIPIRHDNHFYKAELGYLTATNQWLPVASCETMRVPACEVSSSHLVPGGEAGLQTPHQRKMPLASPTAMPPMAGTVGAAGAAAMAASAGTSPDLVSPELAAPVPSDRSTSDPSDRSASEQPRLNQPTQVAGAVPVSGGDQTWVTLTPLNSHHAQVNWHISQEHHLQMQAQGGKHLQMKIHDADQIDLDVQPPHSTHTYACADGEEMHQVELPHSDRDYVAEIGYMTGDQRWLRVARSVHSHSPTPDYDGCRIVIMPCDPNRLIHRGPEIQPQAYVYWDISEDRRQMLRQQGGQMLVLRVYDADKIDLDQQDAHHTEEVVLDELARDKVVEVPEGDRDYVAEIGYRTLDGEFLSLGRSLHAHIPQVRSSAS